MRFVSVSVSVEVWSCISLVCVHIVLSTLGLFVLLSHISKLLSRITKIYSSVFRNHYTEIIALCIAPFFIQESKPLL